MSQSYSHTSQTTPCTCCGFSMLQFKKDRLTSSGGQCKTRRCTFRSGSSPCDCRSMPNSAQVKDKSPGYGQMPCAMAVWAQSRGSAPFEAAQSFILPNELHPAYTGSCTLFLMQACSPPNCLVLFTLALRSFICSGGTKMSACVRDQYQTCFPRTAKSVNTALSVARHFRPTRESFSYPAWWTTSDAPIA